MSEIRLIPKLNPEQPTTSPTFTAAFFKTYKLIIITFCFSLVNWTEADIVGAYMRSTIHCNSTIPYYPPHSGNWSGSNYCTSKHIVLQQATKLTGQITIVNRILSIVSVLVIGSYIDSIGRKPLIVLSFVGYFVCCSLLYLHTWTTSTTSSTSLLFAATAIAAALSSFPVASKAMAADMTSSRDEKERGLVFTWLALGRGCGTLVGFVGGYFVLRMDLTNYQTVWAIFSILCLVVLCLSQYLLVETLETKKNTKDMEEIEEQSESTSGCSAILKGFQLIRNDAFMMSFIMVCFIATTGFFGSILISSSFLIGKSKGWFYSQAVASLAGVFMPIASLFGYVVSGTLCIRKIGTKGTCMIGLLIIGSGEMVIGFFGPSSPIGFWIGWELVGFGLGCFAPTQNAIISARFQDGDQGKVLSLMMVFISFGVATGASVWNLVLYDSSAVGLSAGIPFFWSGAVIFVAAVLYAVFWKMLL